VGLGTARRSSGELRTRSWTAWQMQPQTSQP